MTVTNETSTILLKEEVKLQINQRLFSRGLISREMYEAAMQKILTRKSEIYKASS